MERRKTSETSLIHALLLMTTATIWGLSFVAQRVGMDHLGPYGFNGIRMLLGSIVLFPFVVYRRKKRTRRALSDRTFFKVSILCGLLLFFGTNIQQIALKYSEAGKVGFITTLYIFVVPVFGIFFKRKTPLSTWIAVGLAIIGFYLLSITDGFTIAKGDAIVLGCVGFFAVHILVIDKYAKDIDVIELSCVQFFVIGVLSCILMFIFEDTTWSAIRASAVPLLYSGVLSGCVGYTLQTVGQRGVHPAVAALIMAQESSLSVLFGWIILNERLTSRQLVGCAFMLLGVMVSQVVPALRRRPPPAEHPRETV